MRLIKKSALAVIRNNKLLVVRAKGSSYYLMPGGKPKGGESAIAALEREIMEELSCGIDESSIAHLGAFEDVAAGGDARVLIDLYTATLVGTPRPSSEIDELVWISVAEAADNPKISPIIRNKILPFLSRNKLLS